MPIVPEGQVRAAGAHDQADGNAGNHALQVGVSRRRAVTPRYSPPKPVVPLLAKRRCCLAGPVVPGQARQSRH